MGAREARHFPQSITPTSTHIPMFWQEKELLWSPANACGDGGSNLGQFMLKDPANKDPSCKAGLCPIGADYPQDGANGPFCEPVQSGLSAVKVCDSDPMKMCTENKDCPNGGLCVGNATGKNIKCDLFSYVDPSCTTDQYIRDVYQGSCGTPEGPVCTSDDPAKLDQQCGGGQVCTNRVHWRVLFRRTAAPAKSAKGAATQPADWGPIYKEFYDIVDTIGLRATAGEKNNETWSTVWLDGLSWLPTDMEAKAAQSFSNGLLAGAMPRPGGKRPSLRPEGIRATKWFDKPQTMKDGNCNDCHGTPFNGSDWIRQTPSGTTSVKDDKLPWWHAGNDQVGFTPKNIFTGVTVVGEAKRQSCGSCHSRWMQAAGSTPGAIADADIGGGFAMARFMTMVHQEIAGNPFPAALPPDRYNPTYLDLASVYRTGDMKKYKDTAYLAKNAAHSHYMPTDIADPTTVKMWTDEWNKPFAWVACCGSGLAQAGTDCTQGVDCPKDVDLPAGALLACSKVTCNKIINQKQVVSLFQTPWMVKNGVVPQTLNAGDVPDPTQQIAGPDQANKLKLTYPNPCPKDIGAGPGDQCFQLAWEDPKPGEEFNAPATFHYKQKDQALPAGNPASFPYCTDASLEPKAEGDPDTFTIPEAGTDKPFFPIVNQSPITTPCDPNKKTDCWRFSYQTIGIVKKCTQKSLHICGGWCSQTIKLPGQASRTIVSTEAGLDRDSSGKMLALVNTNGLPQGNLNLDDGMRNFHFNGTGTNQITVLIPSQYCGGGMCTLAHGTASGTQDLQSSGVYTVSSPSNAPFYLTANPDGSFTVTQTSQLDLIYTSQQGTLTGSLTLTSLSGGQSFASMDSTFTATGGSFAQFFPAGGDLFVTLGLTGSLQSLIDHHGFLSAEFQSGVLEPVAACMGGGVEQTWLRGTLDETPERYGDPLEHR